MSKRKHFTLRTYLLLSFVIITLLVVSVLFFLPSPRLFRNNGTVQQIPPINNEHFTIYILGGSTALGEPYSPRADFGQIIRYFFGGAINGRQIDVVNLGGAGKDIANVMKDVKRIAGMKFEVGSAVALLYPGNNEFLKYDNRHDLDKNERSLFDSPTVSNEKRATVYIDYEKRLRNIVIKLRDAGIPVIASTAVVNLKDWSPNRSVIASGKNRSAIETLLKVGDVLLHKGNYPGALVNYEKILELEPAFALAYKRAGDCTLALGNFKGAEKFYQNAVRFDGNPYRETADQNRFLLNLGRQQQLPFVDAASILAEASPDHVVGYEMMWDNCHPNLYGYALIADKMASEIESLFNAKRKVTGVDIGSIGKYLGIDEPFMCNVYVSRGQYCYAASTLTFDPSDRLARADYYFSKALKINPNDIDLLCSLAVYEGIRKNVTRSVSYWQKAYSINPAVTIRRAQDKRVLQIMESVGVKDVSSMFKRN